MFYASYPSMPTPGPALVPLCRLCHCRLCHPACDSSRALVLQLRRCLRAAQAASQAWVHVVARCLGLQQQVPSHLPATCCMMVIR
jgi:hypothetical protein